MILCSTKALAFPDLREIGLVSEDWCHHLREDFPVIYVIMVYMSYRLDMEEQGHVILAEYEQGWAARAEQVRHFRC